MSNIPPEAYRPVRAPASISKLVFKVGYKLRPSGPNHFTKIKGAKGKSAAGKGKPAASKGAAKGGPKK